MRTLKDVNWNQIYYFYEVARNLSVKDASLALGVSKPTVSEQIRKLETLLGHPLFERLSRRLELTEQGYRLFQYAKEMFEVGGRLLDTVSPTATSGYAARVALHEPAASPAAYRLLMRYWEAYEKFGTVNTLRETKLDAVTEGLQNGRLDWALSLERPASKRLAVERVASVELMFQASPAFRLRHARRRDVLSELPIALPNADKRLRDRIDEQLRGEGIFPKDYVACHFEALACELARHGRAVAVSFSLAEGLEAIALTKPLMVDLFAIWAKANETMIAVTKLFDVMAPQRPRRS